MHANLCVSILVTLLFVTILCSEVNHRKQKSVGNRDRKWPLNPSLQSPTSPHKKSGSIGIVPYNGKQTWDWFQQSINRNEKRERSKAKAMRRHMSRSFSMRSSMGLPGPRGPAGPRGPKGANVTKEEMFEEFRAMIDEITKQKILLAADPRCTELCVNNLGNNESRLMSDLHFLREDNDLFVPRIVSSFMWDLKKYTKVPKQAKVELDMFESASKPGAYGRDAGNSDALSGRFVAPRTGFYTFNARMHIRLPEITNRIPRNELFSVQICIDSSLLEKTSLETVSGLGPGDIMTVTVTGVLYLKMDQYVSIFVDNASNYELTFLDGSQFSGYLVGV